MKLRYFIFYCFLFLPIKSFSQDVLPVNEFSGLNTDDSSLALISGQTPDSQNVVTDRGGLQGRKGFIRYSTQPASDIFQFPLSNGTRYFIKRSSNTLLADTGSGAFATVVSTIPTDRKTVVTVLGDRLYFMNTTDGLKYWDATSVFVASASINGTMLVTFKGRLAVAGIGGQERVLRLSKYLDGTTWIAPANATDDDAAIITISGALDENIQALYSAFQDKLVWFKKNSFGGIFGSRRSNFIQRTFSDTVGVAAPETIQDCDGYLRWLGNNRKVWEFDGNTYYKISDQVNNLFSAITQGDSATRSTVLTSQADWDQGTYGNSVVPSGNLSSSILPGSIVLSTMAASSFVDTVSTDFAAGTLTNIDTTTTAGSIQISFGTESQKETTTDSNGFSNFSQASQCNYLGQSFDATTSYFLTSVSVKISKIGTFSDVIVHIYSDNSSLPNTELGNGVLSDGADITSSFSFKNIPITAVGSQNLLYLASGTRYWILIGKPSAGASNLRWAVSGLDPSGVPARSDNFNQTSCANTFQFQFQYITLGKQYPQNGNIISRTFDIGFTTNTWLFNYAFTAHETDNGQTVAYAIQSSTSTNGPWTSQSPILNGSSITVPSYEFVRYISTLTTANQLVTPTLDDVTISYGPFLKSSGTYASKLVSIGNQVSSWGPITIGNLVSSGASETFQIGSTNTASLSAITNWTTITNNSIPSISTNPYVAFRSTFSATRATDTAELDDFTFSWTEGSTLRPASGYTDQRYWLSVATNSTTNNIIYIYDRKKQWQHYSGINADTLGQFNSNLYFGNSTGIYQTEQGYSDAGSDITAYYKTKDFAPSGPDIQTIFNYTYLTTDSSDGILSSSYQMNGSTTSIALGSYQMNQPFSLQNFKIPFPVENVVQGKFLNLKWNVTGTDFWRIIAVDIYNEKGTVPN